MKEADLQRRVIDLARLRGWAVAHFHDSRRQVRPGIFVGDQDAKGFPDLVLCHVLYGVMFAELKSETGRVSPEQQAWLTALKLAGQRAYVWRPADWPEIVRLLGGAPHVADPGSHSPMRPGSAAPPKRRRYER